jgi:hypothetical protein
MPWDAPLGVRRRRRCRSSSSMASPSDRRGTPRVNRCLPLNEVGAVGWLLDRRHLGSATIRLGASPAAGRTQPNGPRRCCCRDHHASSLTRRHRRLHRIEQPGRDHGPVTVAKDSQESDAVGSRQHDASNGTTPIRRGQSEPCASLYESGCWSEPSVSPRTSSLPADRGPDLVTDRTRADTVRIR